MAQGDIVPVLLAAMLSGSALAVLGETAAPVTQLVETLSKAFFRIVRTITSLAPIGAFGAMSFTIGRYGIVSLLPMLKLVGAFYFTAFCSSPSCWASWRACAASASGAFLRSFATHC